MDDTGGRGGETTAAPPGGGGGGGSADVFAKTGQSFGSCWSSDSPSKSSAFGHWLRRS